MRGVETGECGNDVDGPSVAGSWRPHPGRCWMSRWARAEVEAARAGRAQWARGLVGGRGGEGSMDDGRDGRGLGGGKTARLGRELPIGGRKEASASSRVRRRLRLGGNAHSETSA